MICIQHATVYTPDEVIEDGMVLLADGRIQAIAPSHQIELPERVNCIDATGLHLVPGFIDLQLNGAIGLDFTSDPGSIWAVADYLPQTGVTSFLPTIITSPLTAVAAAQKVITNGPPKGFQGATPLGLHIEGPFLHPDKKGAHNPAHLQLPTAEKVADWTPENGVRLVTLAPELDGALAVAKLLAERGVVVSAGHSTANFAQATAGFDAGIRYGTHLFNAMSPLHHREPGLAGALLADERATIGLIVDGEHVHPELVKLVWQMVGNGRLTLVTDAMAALGMPPGRYALGDYEVIVDETTARLPSGTLAGSLLRMDTAVRNLITFTGCTLAEALPTVTRTPADLLGLPHKGRLAPTCDADLLLLTPDLEVHTTIIAGKILFQK
ncbi:MAG: N-acetylglucosamine-6-phosphate deacetylase [Ardenticatenaceae bacterium]|nr:N-acetylglucosamine-6-phosphate deacetylase [Anaerolineales bacterium]MCB8938712.1 N-acetylglucosamine-6-phosphate deacetylase [Ardenticatenaceae bacterium]MCB8973948.1 N-acetylglucosamine-6-phosphate deacetylase [Ardenticatenaceae bacterium]